MEENENNSAVTRAGLPLKKDVLIRAGFPLKGGEGSGNFGHEGRPGEVGGAGGGGGGIPDTIDGLNSFIEERGLADTGYFEDMNPQLAAEMTGAVNVTMNRVDLNYVPDKLLMLGNEDLGKALMETDGRGAGASIYINSKTSTYELKNDYNHGRAALDAGGHPYGASGYLPAEENMQMIVDHEFGHIVYDNVGKENVAAWEKSYDKSSKQLGNITDYSLTDSHEGFAEMYSLYVNGKEDLIPATFRGVMDKMGLKK